MKLTTEQHVHEPVSSIRSEPFSLPAGTQVIDDSLETIEGLYEYNHWIYNQLRPYLGQDVLEVGSGTGNITQFLAMNARRVAGVEPVTSFVQRFNDRLGHMSHVSCTHGYLQDLPEPLHEQPRFDTVVSCNVLEHIEDDVSALRSMMTQIRPGGRVLIFVPACPFAFGKLDSELGHYRRYSKRSLRSAMIGAGLEWEHGRYSNAVGLLGWFVNSVLLRKKHVPAKQAKLFDKLVPFISAIERLLPMPMGQSVLGVGRKPLRSAMMLDYRHVGRKAA
ncbi:MAG: methyltransferase domain-containing protein [Phycisphaeraceae bacterium]